MSNKSKCLAINPNLYIKRIGAGMYSFYQVFEGQYFFANSAKTEQQAWALALVRLEQQQ